MLRYVSAVVLALSLSAFVAPPSEAARPSWAGANRVVPTQAGAEGIYEAPMVDASTGLESPSSEAKIGRDGSVKVEIASAPAGQYTLCLENALNAELMVLQTITLEEDGELTFSANVGGGTIVAPAFSIFAGDACSGDLLYRSGLTTGL